MIPKIIPRRPFEDEKPDGYLESDQDFVKNNFDACVWFLENHEKLVCQKNENHPRNPQKKRTDSLCPRNYPLP